MMAVSYWVADPALNVNLSHAPWAPVASWFPQLWMWWSFEVVASAFVLAAADRVLRRLLLPAHGASPSNPADVNPHCDGEKTHA